MQEIETSASICVPSVDTFIEALRLLQTLIKAIVLSAFVLGDRKVCKKKQKIKAMLLL